MLQGHILRECLPEQSSLLLQHVARIEPDVLNGVAHGNGLRQSFHMLDIDFAFVKGQLRNRVVSLDSLSQ